MCETAMGLWRTAAAAADKTCIYTAVGQRPVIDESRMSATTVGRKPFSDSPNGQLIRHYP